ncbi:MAG TPA: Rsd/AlgQ family anti-sigma factor [Gammaproteobacteria bacterium]|nr:Rsd/AlgQ family anti-sigma factor [Gammaproteobacteria bacterium]
MASPDNVFQERRAASLSMIQELVDVRTEMLSLYSELAAQQPFEASEPTLDLLEQFCQALIDYTADAHFRLYRFIDERRERRRAVLEVADRVYPCIVTTTQAILDFNDKYDFEDQAPDLSSLEDDLSRLGECLADRIELEDQVIRVMKGRREGE